MRRPDPDPGGRPGGAADRGEAGRAGGAAAEQRLTDGDVAEIRAIGDNTGCMALKGASPEHEGEERPDRWPLDADLVAVGERWGIDPERDLVRRSRP